jgi:hypothetical protein
MNILGRAYDVRTYQASAARQRSFRAPRRSKVYELTVGKPDRRLKNAAPAPGEPFKTDQNGFPQLDRPRRSR